ncbi:hypothetical protein phytr_10810 [Candidatus Phycorickettsia trachydisci]|uniref:Uncharacterized protein n=1 Tax=Candidatus Phycorickettsia trachydisci TaxID=2115978 RepID=A0A2P1P9R9_9RICK|nr:hypothetical protein [Candidatus Phycorickettsia trachydisci]AVP88008.1 hypothetical protein phytr_10810 [Candidatus Phycorickettsia trachydisci]
MRKKLLIALIICTKCLAALPPEGKTQMIIQGQISKPSKRMHILLDNKINIQKAIILLEDKLLKVGNTTYLTKQQKIHKQNKIYKAIKKLKEIENTIPDSKEEKIIISTIEQSVRENMSLGIQALLKENKLLNNRRERPIEAKIFSQFQFLKWRKKKTERLFIISPHIILTHYSKPQPGAKIISEKYVHYKKRTNISQMEFGITQGPWGVKYSFGISSGVKFNNGFLFMMQNFTDIDKKNPIKVYRANSKQLASVIKDNYDQGFSWQIGLFNYTTPKLRISLYRGVFFSLWRYF